MKVFINLLCLCLLILKGIHRGIQFQCLYFNLHEGYVLDHQRKIVIHHEVYLLISSIAPFGFVWVFEILCKARTMQSKWKCKARHKFLPNSISGPTLPLDYKISILQWCLAGSYWHHACRLSCTMQRPAGLFARLDRCHLLGQELAFCVLVLVPLKEDGIHQKNIFSSKDSIKRSIQMTVEKKLLQRNFSSVEKIYTEIWFVKTPIISMWKYQYLQLVSYLIFILFPSPGIYAIA